MMIDAPLNPVQRQRCDGVACVRLLHGGWGKAVGAWLRYWASCSLWAATSSVKLLSAYRVRGWRVSMCGDKPLAVSSRRLSWPGPSGPLGGRRRLRRRKRLMAGPWRKCCGLPRWSPRQ